MLHINDTLYLVVLKTLNSGDKYQLSVTYYLSLPMFPLYGNYEHNLLLINYVQIWWIRSYNTKFTIIINQYMNGERRPFE